MAPLTRRALLGGIASIGMVPVGFWPAGSLATPTAARPRRAIRPGWDPAVEAPTEATLYVSPDGDDASEGSLTRPLRTIQAGVDRLARLPGGSLAIRAGTYREMVDLGALQGRPDAPYRLHRYGTEQVRISAADLLTGWQPCPPSAAAAFGVTAEGTFVARLPKDQLRHGSIHALNLHEAGQWCSIATDRADPTGLERIGDPRTFHPAQFLYDAENRITAIQDSRLIGLPPAWLAQVRVLFYHSPNRVSSSTIESFDPASGTLVLAMRDKKLQVSGHVPKMLYALQNMPRALNKGTWFAREDGQGQVEIYFRPRDPAHLETAVELSLRPCCLDLGSAREVELFGLEILRAAGESQLDGICLRSTAEPGSGAAKLRLRHCRVGENLSVAARGYAALYLSAVTGLEIDRVSIAEAHNSFGLFLNGCREADMRQLHIREVSNSPARFFGLRHAVLAFSLFEDSGYDAHANKFNFYEGSDSILVYGVRTRNVGGYATYQEASNIHFAFCELDCAPASQNRALVSQNRPSGSKQGGPDDSGDPVAGSTFHYWNNSLLADPAHLSPANALSLGPGKSSQIHELHNNILHGGGFDAIYREGADPRHEIRSHNRYTGFSFWQKPRYGWGFAAGEAALPPGRHPAPQGFDMRPLIAARLAAVFPGFQDWDLDIDGTPVDWDHPPIGCRV